MPEVVLLACGLALVVLAVSGSQANLRDRLSLRVSYRIGSPTLKQRLLQAVNQVRVRLRKNINAGDLRQLASLFEALTLAERLLAAGDSTAGAIEWISARVPEGNRARKTVFTGLQQVAARVRSGGSLVLELQQWQKDEPNRETQEFLAKLIAATRQGSGVIELLRSFRQSVDSAIKARQLSDFSGTETKMMLPLVFLVLPITVLFAVFPSVSLLNLDF